MIFAAGVIYLLFGLGAAAGVAFHDRDGIGTWWGAMLCVVGWPVAWGYFIIKHCASEDVET